MIDKKTADRLKRTIARVYESSYSITSNDVAWLNELIDRETSDEAESADAAVLQREVSALRTELRDVVLARDHAMLQVERLIAILRDISATGNDYRICMAIEANGIINYKNDVLDMNLLQIPVTIKMDSDGLRVSPQGQPFLEDISPTDYKGKGWISVQHPGVLGAINVVRHGYTRPSSHIIASVVDRASKLHKLRLALSAAGWEVERPRGNR